MVDGPSASEAGISGEFFTWKDFDEAHYDEILRSLDDGADYEDHFGAVHKFVAEMLELSNDDIVMDMVLGNYRNPTGSSIDYADKEGRLMGIWLLLDQEDGSEEPDKEMYVEYDRDTGEFINPDGIRLSREKFEEEMNKIHEENNGYTFWAVKRPRNRANFVFSRN